MDCRRDPMLFAPHISIRTAALTSLLAATGAWANDPFEAPEDYETPPAQVEAAPAQAPVSAPRREARLVFAAEGGWNGLAGVGGVNALIHMHRRYALDLGVGYSPAGTKVGTRFRYKFLNTAFKPFAGAGYAYTTGRGSHEDVVRSGFVATTYKVTPSHSLALTTGVEYLAPFGLDVLAAVGYSWLLNSNIQAVDRPLNTDQRLSLSNLYGSGLSVSMSVGYAF